MGLAPAGVKKFRDIIDSSGVNSNDGGAEMYALLPGASEAVKGEMMPCDCTAARTGPIHGSNCTPQHHVQGSRIQITPAHAHASRPFSTTPVRREANDEFDDESQSQAVAGFIKDIESGKIPLELLQQGADIDPADYKAYATRPEIHRTKQRALTLRQSVERTTEGRKAPQAMGAQDA